VVVWGGCGLQCFFVVVGCLGGGGGGGGGQYFNAHYKISPYLVTHHPEIYCRDLLNITIRHLKSIMLDAHAVSSPFIAFTSKRTQSALIMKTGHGGRL